MDKFDPYNLSAANKEVQDLISVACLQGGDRAKFLTMIRKELATRNITLDYIERTRYGD